MPDSKLSRCFVVDRRVTVLVIAACVCVSVALTAQRGGNAIASLKGVAIPQSADLGRYVADPQMLVVLGKALFWDTQVGSDGRTACATCHFHAGADHRMTNELAGPQSSTVPLRPNTSLTLADFPFHAFADPNSNTSPTPGRQPTAPRWSSALHRATRRARCSARCGERWRPARWW